jgi:Methyltransferase domain
VTGLDLVPEMLEGGRAKAQTAGVEIKWVEDDAEQLPFEDGSFDRVLSTFGHMFAPRHRPACDPLLPGHVPGGRPNWSARIEPVQMSPSLCAMRPQPRRLRLTLEIDNIRLTKGSAPSVL